MSEAGGEARSPTPVPRVRLRGHEAAGEAAFGLLDALWSGPLGLAVLDRELRLVQANGALEAALGRPAAALAGRSLPEALGVQDPARTAREDELVAGVLATGEPRTGVVLTGAGPDGAPRDWSCSLYPVIGPDGNARAVCAILDEPPPDWERDAALERARAGAAMATRRLAELQDVTSALAAAATPEDVARVVDARLRPAVGAAVAVLRLAEGEALSPVGLGPGAAQEPPLPLAGRRAACEAVRRQVSVHAGSMAELARWPEDAARARRDGHHALFAVPLVVRERGGAVLELRWSREREVDGAERARLEALAEQVAQALDRALLYRGESALRAARQRARTRLARTHAITAALSQARTAEDTASVLALQAHESLGAQAVATWVRAGDALALSATVGVEGASRELHARVPLAGGHPAAQAARTGEPVWLEADAAGWRARDAGLGVAPDGRPWPAAAVVPLRARGEPLGVVALAFDSPQAVSPAARDTFLQAAALGAQALERALRYDGARAARAAEARARALLDAVVRAMPLGLALLDRTFRYLLVNEPLARMNGLPADAHVGRSPAELLPGVPRAELEALWRDVAETGVPRLEVPLSGETPAEPGRPRHWLESLYPVRVGGEILGVGAVVREVTAEREAEAFQKHVIGIVGHDLRTPLATIAMTARLLRRQEAAPVEVRVLVERIQRAAERMQEVVALLLDYTRVRAGQGIGLQPVECALDALLLEAVEALEAARPGRRVVTRCEGEGAGRWDRDRLAWLARALVGNALEHGGPGARVEAAFHGREDEVELVIRNDGPPIPPDVLPRIFEPFRRGADARRRDGPQGLGLGLFLARAIAVAHGGSIEARSSADEGTTFTVRLPRRLAPRG